MMRPRLRPALLAALALAGLAVAAVPPVGAEASTRIVDDGWWWRLQTGVGPALPSPPNVGDQQLLVQSLPDGASAIAAVAAVLAEGQASPVLTLDVADDQGGVAAVVLACQAGAAWTGVHAGRWDSAPLADCSTSVTGIRSEDGSQWTFPIAPLQFGDQLNVVLVPGLLADSDTPSSFSLVFDAPTAASIVTSAGPAPTIPSEAPTSTVDIVDAGRPGATIDLSSVPPQIGPAAPALPETQQGRSATAPVVQAASPPRVVVGTSDLTEPRTVVRLVALGLAAVATIGAVVTSRSKMAVAGPATPDHPVEGGLARFRSTRTSEPEPVA